MNSRANICSTNAEVIDLVDDYGYTEKEAKEIICQNALDSSDYLNEGVKITRYKKWTQN